MNNTNQTELIRQLIELLNGGNAHVKFEGAVANIPFNLLGQKPHNLPYSIWQLTEHIRIAQWDILDFSRNPNYKEIRWPDDYWPQNIAPKTEEDWRKCLEQIEKDKQEFISLLHAPEVDLYAPFPYGQGQNLLREALLIADHTSYHTGEIVLVRRLLNAWK